MKANRRESFYEGYLEMHTFNKAFQINNKNAYKT
jgi:hypothetical protein